MNPSQFIDQDQFNDKLLCNEIIEQQYIDYTGCYLSKKKFKILITKDQDVLTISTDGEIIRIDKITKQFKESPRMLFNLEQIYYLQWVGKLENMKKTEKWSATWKGEILNDVGGLYCQEGMKQGRWKEICYNFSDKAKIYEQGEYINDTRQGVWQILQQDIQIGGGLYEKGLKNGLWIELSNNFYLDNQIFYQGEYLYGQKIGRWNIMKKRLSFFINTRRNKKQGSHSYELIGNECFSDEGIKQRKWIQLSDNYQRYSQVTHSGEFNNNQKFGLWDFNHQRDNNRPIKVIGCGIYDIEGFKNGYWFELGDSIQNETQLIYEGKYINGKKIGRWYIKSKNDLNFETIGYGSYDDDGLKDGTWLEESDNFLCFISEVIYYGEYKKGKRIGKWEIRYKRPNNDQFQVIGGGSYTNLGLKDGKWIELSEDFSNLNEVIYKGQYQNGRKVERWYTSCNQFRNIGGGFYDSLNLKDGAWVDFCRDFQSSRMIVHDGEYKNGKKIGLWDNIRQFYKTQQRNLYQRSKGSTLIV